MCLQGKLQILATTNDQYHLLYWLCHPLNCVLEINRGTALKLTINGRYDRALTEKERYTLKTLGIDRKKNL
uniref:Uncharacterized protein n=1 Tax=Pararge aegeria TaxID=116150 RepID=S4P902_9NEOP